MSENGQVESQQQMIMLAAIGDLEVTRRALIMEIQARDQRIAELEQQLGIHGAVREAVLDDS